VISLSDTISDIVMPAVRAVFKDAEVSAISVRFDPDLHGGSMVLTLTAVGESFSDVVVQGKRQPLQRRRLARAAPFEPG